MKLLELHLLRFLWLVLPFAVGPVIGAATDDADNLLRLGLSALLWIDWAAMMVALMVPRTQTLTAVRMVVPAALVVVLWAVIAAGENALSVPTIGGATVVAGLAAILAWRAPVGDLMVDGSSYGDEARFLLRTPGALAVGPLFVLWAATAVPAFAGIVLTLTGSPVLGVPLILIGAGIAWVAVPAFHRLSNRWLVFVPAGLVVHDKTALREPQLFRRDDIVAFGPATTESADTATDLTLGSHGLVLRIRLESEQKIIPNRTTADGAPVEPEPVAAMLVAPNQPGDVIRSAAERAFVIA